MNQDLTQEPIDHAFYKEILNSEEIAELETYNEKPYLQSALKKVLLTNIYYRGTMKKGESPDPNKNFLFLLANQTQGAPHDRLGADLIARTYALQIVEYGFTELGAFKKMVIPKKENKNPGR